MAIFSLSHDFVRPCDQSVMILYGQEPIKVSYHPARFGDRRNSGKGDNSILSRDLGRTRDQRVMQLYGWKPLMASHHTAKFGCHVHCDGWRADTTSSCLNPGLLLSLKHMTRKEVAYHINKSDSGRTLPGWQMMKHWQKNLLTFCYWTRVEKEGVKNKNGYCKAFYITRKCNKVSKYHDCKCSYMKLFLNLIWHLWSLINFARWR